MTNVSSAASAVPVTTAAASPAAATAHSGGQCNNGNQVARDQYSPSTPPPGAASSAADMSAIMPMLMQLMQMLMQMLGGSGSMPIGNYPAPAPTPATPAPAPATPAPTPATPAAPAPTPATPAPAPAPVIHQWNPQGGSKDFVKTLYENVLDREPESQGVIDGWAANSDKNGLASTLKGFFNSPEYQGKNHSVEETVEKLYGSILGRQSDAGGKAFWVDQIKSGKMSLDQVIDGFVGSDEYKGDVAAGNKPNPAPVPPPIRQWSKSASKESMVTTFYQNILGRDPENGGVVNGWAANTIQHGIASTAKGFFNSAEYQGQGHSVEETVEKLYGSLLGRQSDAGGKAFWVDQIKSGKMNLDQVIDGFVASDEFKAKA